MAVSIRLAASEDATTVASLVEDLVSELTGLPIDPKAAKHRRTLADRMVGADTSYIAFLALDEADNAIAVLTLNRCNALYANGAFGEIAELFVKPARRSEGIAAELIKTAVQHAVDRNWTRLEVGTGPQPKWSRSLAFYHRSGFVEIGPRLKLELCRDAG